MITMRLGTPQMDAEISKQYVEAILRNKNSMDHVWITTMGMYPSLEIHKRHVERWKVVAKMFRDAGIRVSMQISNTFGHSDANNGIKEGYGDGMMENGESVDPLVGPDGTRNKSCFCWNSPRLREYMRSIVALYAKEIHPERIWFDDDLRASGHTPNRYCCYCDKCMAKFNQQYGTSFTREELVHEINYGDIAWREKFIAFTRQGIYDFTYIVARAAVDIYPDIRFAYQYGHFINYMGNDDHFILKAMYDACGGYPVETRPGGLHYNDKAPWGQFEKAMDIAYENSLVPEYVSECKAELENLPGVAYGKSIGGIINEGTLYLATGCTGLTFTDIQSWHEPAAYYEKILAKFSENRTYWEKLSAISRNCYRGGICIYEGEKPHLKRLSDKDEPYSWVTRLSEKDINLFRIGIPVMYDKRLAKVYLLHHNSVEGLTDEDIRFLLTQPVVTDGESVDKLIQRGWGDYFGFDIKYAPQADYEVFTQHSVNGSRAGIQYGENPYASKPMRRYIFENAFDNMEVLGEAYKGMANFESEGYVGPTTILTQIQNPAAVQKVKWAVFGYSIWSDLVSTAKRNQILNAIDTISPLAAKLISDEQAAVASSVDKDGKTVAVTIASASQGGTEELLMVARNVVGNHISIMGTTNKDIKPLHVKWEDDEVYIMLPALKPYEIITVFFA